MSVGTPKFDKGILLRIDREQPPMPPRFPESLKSDSQRLRIVRMDEPALPSGKSWEDAANFFRAPRHPLTERFAEERTPKPVETEKEVAVETIPPREPGVDLATVQPRDVDTAKLSAFVHAVPAAWKDGKRGASQAASGKAIVMPLAKTDLREIFQADKICIVAQPQANAPPSAADAESNPDPPPAAPAAVPPKKTPHYLDETQRYLVENWPKLPPNVQAAILNVIDAAISPDDE